MTRYGIIGKPLEHSYSARYFTEKFLREGIDAEYRLYELDDLSNVSTLMHELHGFNVTYPYKQTIMPHLRAIDTVAEAIGAVNVVCQGKGYNTDWIGFRQSILPHLTPDDQRALVLGTGGVSKAVQYALREMGIDYTLVSRQEAKGERREAIGYGQLAMGDGIWAIGYGQLTKEVMEAHTVVVNCTPLGMYPDTASLPDIPYQHLTAKHLLYDCVYNPALTAFLQKGQEQGSRTVNGLDMLYAQANAAWEIWRGV